MDGLSISGMPLTSVTQGLWDEVCSVYETARYNVKIDFLNSKGYIFNELSFKEKTFRDCSGTLFVCRNKSAVVAYALCFDNVCKNATPFANLFGEDIKKYLEHELSFLAELHSLGTFAYLDQIVVTRDERGKGIGKYLLKYIEDYYIGKKARLIAAIIHETNYYPIKFFASRGYLFLDTYQFEHQANPLLIQRGTTSSIWYRIAKILDPQLLFETPSVKWLERGLALFIKLRLSHAVMALNRMLAPHHAVLLWAGWIQEDNFLKRFFPLPLSDFCYYNAIALADQNSFNLAVKAPATILDYYRKRAQGEAATIIPFIRHKGRGVILHEDQTNTLTVEWLPSAEYLNIAQLSPEVLRPFGEFTGEQWDVWIRLYQQLYEIDKAVVSGQATWMHCLLPASFDESYMIGVFFTLMSLKSTPGGLIQLILNCLSASFVDCLIRLRSEIIRLHALRSAVAAIMARNMSHHEGSHILPRALVSNILWRLQELELGLPLEDRIAVIQNAKDRLDEYIAKKQDFLAEITSEPLTTTKTAYFWQDVIAPMVQNVLLMDTIAANEGVRYADKERNRLVLKVFFNGQEVKARFSCTHHGPVIYPDSYPYTGFCTECNRYNEQALLQFTGTERGEDFAVELPGPVGEHAVYTFLENLIRNATKHNLQKLQTNPNQSVEVCIDVAEEDEEFYRVEVSENLSEASVAKKLEGYIKTPLVDDAGELKREAWGIAEMKVAAALLKGSTEWEKLQGDTAKEFLDVKEKDGKLVYRLYMMRPKRVCALVPNHGLEVDIIERMKRAGVWIFRDIQEVKDALYKSRSPASFKFAFFDLKNIANQQDLESLDLKELEPCLPFRVIVRVKSELRQQVQALLPNAVFVDYTVSYSISDPEKFVCELWRSWLGRWAEKAELHLYLGQKEGQKPTSDWKALAEEWSADGYRPFIWYDREQEQNGSKKRVQVSEPDSGNSEPPRVVFDRHAVIANQLRMGPELGIKDCYFAFDKLNSDFIWIFSSNPSEEMVYSLLEAGLLRILVVDSRIAERAYDYDVINQEWTASLVPIMESTIFRGVPRKAGDRPDPMRWHIGCIGKVFICTHLGINGDPLPLHPSAKEVPYLKLRVDMGDSSPSACIELKSNGGVEMRKIRIGLVNGRRGVSGDIDFDMIIIHQGDIESRRPEGFNYSDFIASLKRLFPFVVVDSGRGIPPEVQSTPGVKFLPFSLLNSYLGGKRIDKARLTQVVMPLRRRLQQ